MYTPYVYLVKKYSVSFNTTHQKQKLLNHLKHMPLTSFV